MKISVKYEFLNSMGCCNDGPSLSPKVKGTSVFLRDKGNDSQ